MISLSLLEVPWQDSLKKGSLPEVAQLALQTDYPATSKTSLAALTPSRTAGDATEASPINSSFNSLEPRRLPGTSLTPACGRRPSLRRAGTRHSSGPLVSHRCSTTTAATAAALTVAAAAASTAMAAAVAATGVNCPRRTLVPEETQNPILVTETLSV